VTLPLPGQSVPIVGYFIQYLAFNKIDVQIRRTAKSVENADPEKKAHARTEVLSKLELKNQIFKEGQKRSYLTIALCVVCCFLGIFPTLSLIIAICSTAMVAISLRKDNSISGLEIQALTRGNAADHEFLRKIQLGGLI
jgi:hypothetical protein